MQRPNTGELLRGLRQSLAEQVLPTLPRGVPQQQMKAALHLIGRLERSWDLAAAHLAADNADITAVLCGLLGADGPDTAGADTLSQMLANCDAPAPQGFNDPALREAARRNRALHHILLDMPHSAALAALHARMVERDRRYVGDGQEDPGE